MIGLSKNLYKFCSKTVAVCSQKPLTKTEIIKNTQSQNSLFIIQMINCQLKTEN